MVKAVKTHVYAILDRSGSMATLEDDTIGGYNSFIDKLDGDGITVTLVLFDDKYEVPYKEVSLKAVVPLSREIYYVRGGTALLDAVGKTINENKQYVKENEKAIVLIITDGYENSSKEYKGTQIHKMIRELEKKNWAFTYLGANQDAWAVARDWGFQQGNVATYNATERGTQQIFRTMAVNTAAYAASGAMNGTEVGAFYSDEDKKALKDAK